MYLIAIALAFIVLSGLSGPTMTMTPLYIQNSGDLTVLSETTTDTTCIMRKEKVVHCWRGILKVSDLLKLK